jgi:hypothetical protein
MFWRENEACTTHSERERKKNEILKPFTALLAQTTGDMLCDQTPIFGTICLNQTPKLLVLLLENEEKARATGIFSKRNA